MYEKSLYSPLVEGIRGGRKPVTRGGRKLHVCTPTAARNANVSQFTTGRVGVSLIMGRTHIYVVGLLST